MVVIACGFDVEIIPAGTIDLPVPDQIDGAELISERALYNA